MTDQIKKIEYENNELKEKTQILEKEIQDIEEEYGY